MEMGSIVSNGYEAAAVIFSTLIGLAAVIWASKTQININADKEINPEIIKELKRII